MRHHVDSKAVMATIELTQHAMQRARARGIPLHAIELVLTYGRRCFRRHALIFSMGRREVELHAGRIDLAEFEGLHVVCAPKTGVVLTVYRNRDFRCVREAS